MVNLEQEKKQAIIYLVSNHIAAVLKEYQISDSDLSKVIDMAKLLKNEKQNITYRLEPFKSKLYRKL